MQSRLQPKHASICKFCSSSSLRFWAFLSLFLHFDLNLVEEFFMVCFNIPMSNLFTTLSYIIYCCKLLSLLATVNAEIQMFIKENVEKQVDMEM